MLDGTVAEAVGEVVGVVAVPPEAGPEGVAGETDPVRETVREAGIGGVRDARAGVEVPAAGGLVAVVATGAVVLDAGSTRLGELVAATGAEVPAGDEAEGGLTQP